MMVKAMIIVARRRPVQEVCDMLHVLEGTFG